VSFETSIFGGGPDGAWSMNCWSTTDSERERAF